MHLITDVSTDSNWDGTCALYCHSSGDIYTLPYNVAAPVSLKVLEHEIYTVTPIKTLAPGIQFAPVGLINMYNAGGAIEGLKYKVMSSSQSSEVEQGYKEKVENLNVEAVAVVSIEVKGCGRFGAYSSAKPRKCTLGTSTVEFTYDPASGLISLILDSLPKEDTKVHSFEIEL